MKCLAILSLTLVSILTTACTTTKDTQQVFADAVEGSIAQKYKISKISNGGSDAPEKYQNELRESLNKELKKQGLLDAEHASREVDILITEFTLSNGESRGLNGVLVGNGVVRTHIYIVDTATEESVGYSSIEIQGNLGGEGAKLFTTQHAKAIVNFLRSKS